MSKTSSLNKIIQEKKDLEDYKAYRRKKQQKISKKKYDDSHYASLQVHLDKSLVSQFKALSQKLGIKQTDILRYFVFEFLKNHDKYISLIADSSQEKIKDFDYDEYVLNTHIEMLDSKLSSFTSDTDIVKFFVSPFEKNLRSDLYPLAQFLGFDVNSKTNRTDIIGLLTDYYTSKRCRI